MFKLPVWKTSVSLVTVLVFAACGREIAAPPAAAASEAMANQGRFELTTAAEGGVFDVDASEFKTMADRTGGTYLDVRTPAEVTRGHIADASVVDISDSNFVKKVARMQRSRPVFVYCASGQRSGAAARKLKSLGFATVYNLRGGITAWRRAGLSVVRGDAGEAHADGMSVADFDRLVASPQPVLIDFHTPWCAPCKRMAPVVDAIAVDYAGKATVLRVDVDLAEALATREKIEGVPVLVIYKAGKELWRHSGEVDRAIVEQRLAAAM